MIPSRLSSLAAAALLLAGTSIAHAAPDAALFAAAEKAQPALMEQLKTMVLIESGSKDAAGLAKMADLVDGQLKQLGFATVRHKATAGIGADIVVGTLQGSGRRKIMLQGHMDTVYAQGILATQPYKVEGNQIYGPGIADDKGGIAVVLASLGILREAGWKDYDTLTVMFNPDEEVGSIGSGELISQLADQHDVVLSFEPTAAKSVAKGESILLGAAGIAQATMDVTGRAAHAGAAPERGRNALYELSYQLLATKDVANDVPGATLNWTVAKADGPVNQITAKAEAIGDIRITEPGAEKKLDAALQAKLASGKLIPDTQTTLKVEVHRPAFRAGDKGQALAAKAQAIYQEMDRELGLVPMTGGGTDAGFAGRSGKATVLESFGLAGFGYHAKDEFIEADSIVPRLYLVTRLLTEIGKGS